MPKILVTGGAGFIGANFVQYICSLYADKCRLVVVDALTYAGHLGSISSQIDADLVEFRKAEIQDEEAMRGIFKEFQPSLVINFAAESHVDRSIISSAPFIDTNIRGTQVLLDLSREFSVSKFVQVSTDEVYGELGDTGAFTEDMPLMPSSPYSASKAAADLLVLSYVRTYGFPAVITRCSNNYGPYQFPEKLIPLMISNAQNGDSLPVYGNGKNVRDWIYVEDHCRGIDLVCQKGAVGEVYHFGGASERQNIEVVRAILSLLGQTEELISYVDDRPGHDYRYAIDYSKSERELGWTPTVGFEQGLAKTVQWYQENGDWLDTVKSGEYQRYYEENYSGR